MFTNLLPIKRVEVKHFISPTLVGFIYRLDYGNYYLRHSSGTTRSRKLAHIFTSADIKHHMKGPNGWGGKLHGKWIPLYVK